MGEAGQESKAELRAKEREMALLKGASLYERHGSGDGSESERRVLLKGLLRRNVKGEGRRGG